MIMMMTSESNPHLPKAMDKRWLQGSALCGRLLRTTIFPEHTDLVIGSFMLKLTCPEGEVNFCALSRKVWVTNTNDFEFNLKAENASFYFENEEF